MKRFAIAAIALAFATLAQGQQKEIKIGFIYDVSGPFAGGGSEPAQIGTVGSSRVDLQACKLEYSIVSPK